MKTKELNGYTVKADCEQVMNLSETGANPTSIWYKLAEGTIKGLKHLGEKDCSFYAIIEGKKTAVVL